jgi:hypothetical protein
MFSLDLLYTADYIYIHIDNIHLFEAERLLIVADYFA